MSYTMTDALDELVAMSAELGAPANDYAIIGEGNTSVRADTDTFWVKASGAQLALASRTGFVRVRFAPILAALEQREMTDAEVKQTLQSATVEGERTPSIETFLHALCLQLEGVGFVGHTHPTAAVGLLCGQKSRELFSGNLFPDQIVVLGPAFAYVNYADPGLPLAHAVRQALRDFSEQHGRPPKVVLLENHGVIVLGKTAQDVLNGTQMLVKTCRILAGTAAAAGPRFLSPAQVDRIDRRPDELARRKGFVQPSRGPLSSFLACILPGAWLWLLLSTVLSGWAADPAAPAPAARPEPLRLVFISCAVDAKFFEPVKQGMRDAARMLNVQCEFKGTPGVDVKAQAEMVRQAVRDRCQGIALNLIDPVAFDDVVQEAIAAGVPVVGFNVDDHDTPNARLAAVNQRLYDAGRKLGAWVAPHLPTGSPVLLTLHDQGVSALDDRARGIRDALKDKQIQWTQVITGNISTNGAAVIAQHLRAHPEIRVVLGTGQSDTEAAGLAIRSHFAGNGYWSAGFDLSPTTLQCIQQGHIRGTIDQQPYLQGFYPVVQLTHYLRYGLMPSDLDAGAAIIDRHNVDQVLELTRKGYR